MSSGVIETVDIIDPWIYETLRDDPTITGLAGGRLVSTLSAGNVAAPYVHWFMSSANDVLAVGGIRVMVTAIYTIKAVTEGSSWATAQPIARRIDSLFHQAQVTTPNGHVISVRQSVVQYPEVSQGTQFRHLGSQFRIEAYKL